MDLYKGVQFQLVMFVVTINECGIKLSHDKLGSAVIEEQYQNSTQEVEKDCHIKQ